MGVFSLNEICRKYKYVFLDTNVLLQINIYLDKDKTNEYLDICKIRNLLLDFWTPASKNYSNIYLSKNIVKELRNDHYNYKRDLKKCNKGDKIHVEIRRIKKCLKTKRNSFLNEFPLERIVNRNTLEEKTIPLYDKIYKKYEYLANSVKCIGENDFDLLLLGGLFSRTKGNTTLISNDVGLQNSWVSFLKGESLTRNRYGCYFQKGLNLFQPIFLYGE